MKTILILSLVCIGGVARAADACCAALESAAKPPACCAAMTEKAEPLAERSIYQLDAVWTDDAEKVATLAGLRGRPVVLAMFYSNCEYACPLLVGDMVRLRAALPAEMQEQIQFVMVSFDVTRDTPVALKAYRDRVSLNPAWRLWHGNADAVQDLAMLLGVKYKQDEKGQFAHSNMLTILDAQGVIAHQRIGLGGEVREAAEVLAKLMSPKATKP